MKIFFDAKYLTVVSLALFFTHPAMADSKERQSFAPGEFQIASFYRGEPCPEGKKACLAAKSKRLKECLDDVYYLAEGEWDIYWGEVECSDEYEYKKKECEKCKR